MQPTATPWPRPATPAPHDSRPKAPGYVRAAGRKEMENPPRNWDIIDEQGDESFPASDPPGNY